MSVKINSQGNGVVTGPHNTTVPKASKIDRIIGYIMRKRKQQVPIMDPPKETKTVTILPSRNALQKLKEAANGKNRYGVLDMDLSDRALLGVEENHWDEDGEVTMIGGTAERLFDQENTSQGVGLGVDPADTRVVLKKQKRKTVTVNTPTCHTGCQAEECRSTTADMPNYEKQLEVLPRRLVAKLRAQKTSRFVYSQLLNFLRCKHFMHVRDTHFITTLVADARAWLLNKGYSMEDSIHYSVLTIAVQQAFIVSHEELEFRATLKNPKILDHIDHHNATMSGDLGRVNMFDKERSKHALTKAVRRPFTRSLHLSAPKTDMV